MHMWMEAGSSGAELASIGLLRDRCRMCWKRPKVCSEPSKGIMLMMMPVVVEWFRTRSWLPFTTLPSFCAALFADPRQNHKYLITNLQLSWCSSRNVNAVVAGAGAVAAAANAVAVAVVVAVPPVVSDVVLLLMLLIASVFICCLAALLLGCLAVWLLGCRAVWLCGCLDAELNFFFVAAELFAMSGKVRKQKERQQQQQYQQHQGSNGTTASSQAASQPSSQPAEQPSFRVTINNWFLLPWGGLPVLFCTFWSFEFLKYWLPLGY